MESKLENSHQPLMLEFERANISIFARLSSSLQLSNTLNRVGFTFPSNNDNNNNNNNDNNNKNPHLISQLLLTQFWPNFKSRFLGTYRTDFSCHHDICPGNISPGDICPYQQYLRSYWPNFDQTFGTQFFGGLNFCGPKFFLSHYPPTHHYPPD